VSLSVGNGWLPVHGTRGFHGPLSDPRADLRLRFRGSERDGRNVPNPDLWTFTARVMAKIVGLRRGRLEPARHVQFDQKEESAQRARTAHAKRRERREATLRA
jgi:hypothetical protein